MDDAEMLLCAQSARAEAVYRASLAVLAVVKDLQHKVDTSEYSSSDVADLCKVWRVIDELPAPAGEENELGLVMMPAIMEPEE